MIAFAKPVLLATALLVASGAAEAGERLVTGPRGATAYKSITAQDGVLTRHVDRKGAYGGTSTATQTCVAGSGKCTGSFAATGAYGRTATGSSVATRTADGYARTGLATGPSGGVWTRTVTRR